jgi:hypothetical protein
MQQFPNNDANIHLLTFTNIGSKDEKWEKHKSKYNKP